MDPFVNSLEVSELAVMEDVVEIQPYKPSNRDNLEDLLEPETLDNTRDSINPSNKKEGLTRNQKKVFSKLYKLGRKLSKAISNIEFQKESKAKGIISQQFNFQKRGFLGTAEKLSEAKNKLKEVSDVLREGAHEFFLVRRKTIETEIIDTKEILKKICEPIQYMGLISKWKFSFLKSLGLMKERRERKINGLKQKQQTKKRETSEKEVEDFINLEEFFTMAERVNKKRKNVGERRNLFQKLKRK
jgi:hypothetical protein